jgi:nitronate monooxygenase
MNSLFPHVQIPLISPPMAGVSGGQLAASVTNAGGLGFIGVGHVPDPMAFFSKEVSAARSLLHNEYHDAERLPIGVGVFVWKLDLMERNLAEELLRSAARHSCCVWLSFGEPGRAKDWVQFLRSTPEASGCAVAVLVNTVQEVETLIHVDVQHIPDMLIVQSLEAGGHGSPNALPFISFLPAVLSCLTSADLVGRGRKRPLLIAAGGVVAGSQIISALALGSDGVACGTLFASSEESTYLSAQKKLIVSTSGEDTVRTLVFDQMRYRALYIMISWN